MLTKPALKPKARLLKTFLNSFADFKGTGCDKKFPCQFNIVFSNAGTIGWCKPSPDCKNDGNEYTKDGKAPDPKKRAEERKGGYYRLSSGEVIYAPSGTEVGAVAHRTVPKNATLFFEHNINHIVDHDQGLDQYEYMMDNLGMEEDVVMEAIEGPN